MIQDVVLPTFHTRQAEIYRQRGRFNTVRCGRRWGKTLAMVTIACDAAAKGRRVGLFTPEHKQLQEPYEQILSILQPIKQRASKTEGTIRTVNGGLVDFWTLNDNELAGRGREYDLVMVDEAAFTKNGQMMGIWERSIQPTMVTRPNSSAWMFSTPNGNDPENFFWLLCNDAKLKSEFVEHYAPTSSNPYVPAAELEKERERKHPLIFQQEFLAEFVDFSGVAFFSIDKLLVEGKPVAYPRGCDQVLAVVDCAAKDGTEHDGTAVSFWALSTIAANSLVCLDWDIVVIEGATLETWIPNIARRCEDLAKECRARFGSGGIWIEDASAGTILLQQCSNRGISAQALPSILTAKGKDGRAMNAIDPVHRGEVKISEYAFDKNDVSFKGVTRNHFLSQVSGFRIGDKGAARRADDLLDTFCYAIGITLGDQNGITGVMRA